MIYAIGWLLAFAGAGALTAGVSRQNILVQVEDIITSTKPAGNNTATDFVNPYLATSKAALDNVPGAVGSNVSILPFGPPNPNSGSSNFHLRKVGN